MGQLAALLEAGESPDTCDDAGVSALMHAADRGDPACVEMLLEHRADAHAVDQEGATAQDYAEECGWPEVAQRLASAMKEAE